MGCTTLDLAATGTPQAVTFPPAHFLSYPGGAVARRSVELRDLSGGPD